MIDGGNLLAHNGASLSVCKSQSRMSQSIAPLFELAPLSLLVLGGLTFGGGWLFAWLLGRPGRVRLEEQLSNEISKAADLGERHRKLMTSYEQDEREAESLRGELIELRTRLETEAIAAQERVALLQRTDAKLADTFKLLSAEVLQTNSEQLINLTKRTLEDHREAAKGELDHRRVAIEKLVSPILDSLGNFQSRVNDLEATRQGAYSELRTQVVTMAEAQTALQRETGQLVKALRQPAGRGQWGEMQLRRVVELAGMQERCDFVTQAATTDADGRRPALT